LLAILIYAMQKVEITMHRLQTNNNFYTVVYECIADGKRFWKGINVQYYKGTTPQSTGMTKVTAIGKTAQKVGDILQTDLFLVVLCRT
jgi:hypothetical protein